MHKIRLGHYLQRHAAADAVAAAIVRPTGISYMVRLSSVLQASFQLTHCLAIPVVDVPYVCHAASLAWMQDRRTKRVYTVWAYRAAGARSAIETDETEVMTTA